MTTCIDATPPTTMVLPPHERSSGEVATAQPPAYVHDVRVPRPLRRRDADGYFWDEHEPQVAGHSPYVDDRCPDGRHLFDVIESVIEREVGEPHTDEFVGYEYDFRAVLTCVRCGKVLAWEGTRTEDVRPRVNPVPLVSGDLVAQQVDAYESWGRDMSTWLVYRAGVEVGVIAWGRGKRGRAFHQARLDDWPTGETVEAADPAAALRKLARTTTGRTSAATA